MNLQTSTFVERHRGVLLGAALYGCVCGSGVVAAWVVGLFAITSFFAFIYVLLNGGPRSWGMFFLSLIPVIGALVALERIVRRAGKQVLAGLFFYVFPLMFLAAPVSGRVVGAVLGGGLFFSYFAFSKTARRRPRATFMFMWALPSTLFFVIAAIFVPFIGRAADVGAIDDGLAGDFGMGGEFGTSDFDSSAEAFHAGITSDSSFGEIAVPSSLAFDGNQLDFGIDGVTHDEFHLDSYPDQTIGEPIWSESHFDPVTGRIEVEGSFGEFDLAPTADGNYFGQTADGSMVHFAHNPTTQTLTISGPDGIKAMTQDGATGDWIHYGPTGMTRVRTDPITGWTHVHGPSSEMTIKFNPFNNTAYGSGTAT